MHRRLYICVVLAIVDPALFGQAATQDQSPTSVSTEQQMLAQPKLHQHQESEQRVPATQ
jgi:hypothetical protein